MRMTKKLFPTILALVMALAMTAPALATAPANYSITITNSNEGHTYEAYQIFSGTVSSDEATDGATAGPMLGNIIWGNGVTNYDALLTALQEDATIGAIDGIADAATAADVAAALDGATTDVAIAFSDVVSDFLATTPTGSTNVKTENNTYVIAGLPAGYYLVKDQDESLQGDNDTYTDYIIQVLGNVTMAPKSDNISIEKKVQDVNDSVAGSTTDWQDSADYDIGDHVPFQITIILPNNVDDYVERYHLNITDEMSDGLTYDEGSTQVYVNGVEITAPDDGNWDPTTQNQGTFLYWSWHDIKEAPFNAGSGDIITITYTATLNEKAAIGEEGNSNTVHAEYSNDPNSDGTGTTVYDTVVVFTYQTVVNKVDGDNEALAGAAFQLEKFIAGEGEDTYDDVQGAWTVVGTTVAGDATSFTFTGLDDGVYRLTEITTPNGYNTIEPIEFTITAAHDVLSDTPALTALNGNQATGAITFTSNPTDGSLTTTVVNNAGATLPETGGVGTTLFYIIGGVLVVAAVVILVAKRRVGGHDE